MSNILIFCKQIFIFFIFACDWKALDECESQKVKELETEQRSICLHCKLGFVFISILLISHVCIQQAEFCQKVPILNTFATFSHFTEFA